MNIEEGIIILSVYSKKKIRCLTTPDFQKTNYLKTNLLKQIKKISLSDKIRYFLVLHWQR